MGLFSKKKIEPEEEASPENAPDDMRKRGCRDCCCILFFIAYMIGMLFVLSLAFTYGEPASIMYGKDYLGNRCGVDSMANQSKVIYPRIDRDIAEQAALVSTAPWRIALYGLCVHECPYVADPTVCFSNPGACMAMDYGTTEDQAAAGGRPYWFTVLPTIDVLNRCVPTKHVEASDAPDRCAYPICDNVTNPWMVCDTEHPNLWLMTTLSDRLNCEIKFQHVEVDQLNTMEPSPLVDRIANSMAFAQRVTEALVASQGEILGFGLGLSIAAGIGWLIALRFFAKLVVYLAIISFGLLLAMVTLYLFVTSGALNTLLAELAGNTTDASLANASSAVAAATAQAESAILSFAPDALTQAAADAESSNPFLYQVGAWVCLILTVIYLLMMCIARKKIKIAACLLAESVKTIKDRPSSLLLPICMLALQVPVLLFLVLGLILISTANLDMAHFVGGMEGLLAKGASYADALKALNVNPANLSATSFEFSSGDGEPSVDLGIEVPAESPWWFQPGIYIFFLFGVLWLLESIKNTGWTSLSGNFSDWYFFRRDPKFQSRFPLLNSLKRVLRYHLGSIFFGAFIMALIRLVRILMALLDRATKSQQEANKTLKLVIKGLQACLFCLEKTVKFITDYCYIYVAMQGYSFCTSCFKVFKLIMGHPAQLALNTLIRLILQLLQLIGIPLGCAWLCNYTLESRGRPEPMYAAAVVAVLAFFIAQAFALVMACALDTLFVCTVRDKEEYKGAFMGEDLYAAFGFDKSDRKAKKKAKKAAKAEKAEKAGGDEIAE